MGAEHRVAALLGAGLLALGTLGCAGDTEGGAPPAARVGSPLVGDASLPAPDGGAMVPMPPSLRTWLEHPFDRMSHRWSLRCEWRMDPLLCNGHCPPNQGCCITGIRPRGICQPYGVCDDQCLFDCLSLLYRSGSLPDIEQCESLCTWVPQSAACAPAR